MRTNLDSIEVSFGTCFKPSKMTCKQQMNQCLSCGAFVQQQWIKANMKQKL